MEFLNNYITLQKIRINHKDPVKVNIDVDNKSEKIPPLLFLPLVENAFKHGTFTNPDHQIIVNVGLKKHKLDFSISNPYKPNIPNTESHKGIGLDLVKRRFDLIFPNKHSFKIRKDEQFYTIEFFINLDEA